MALRLGTTLCGSKYSFRLVEKLGDKTVFSPVFKAEVLPGVQSLLPKNRWAVVKSADLENQTQVDCLVKEYKYYKKPSIESSRNFRKLCDIINDPIGWTAQKPFCLAFEWMDTTLAEVPFEEHMKDPILVANIVKVCLEAFVELEKEHLVYSDLKPANVLISSVDGLSNEPTDKSPCFQGLSEPFGTPL
jgi:serine/threonine protein kinase